jgi:hypothetical protein
VAIVDMNTLSIFERKNMREMYGPVKEWNTGE